MLHMVRQLPEGGQDSQVHRTGLAATFLGGKSDQTQPIKFPFKNSVSSSKTWQEFKKTAA